MLKRLQLLESQLAIDDTTCDKLAVLESRLPLLGAINAVLDKLEPEMAHSSMQRAVVVAQMDQLRQQTDQLSDIILLLSQVGRLTQSHSNHLSDLSPLLERYQTISNKLHVVIVKFIKVVTKLHST